MYYVYRPIYPGGPKTEWPTSAILMQKPITASDRTSF